MHGLKPGDHVYSLPMFLNLGGPIGVDEYEVIRVTDRGVTAVSTKRSTRRGRVRHTFYQSRYGTEWHLTAEAALGYVISMMEREIKKSERRIDQARLYLAAMKKRELVSIDLTH